MLRMITLSAFLLLGAGHMAAGAVGNVSHLTVYEAGVGEFLETRTVELQPGLNTVEWRSIMPQAHVRTMRVTAENAEVVRQDVSYDGALAGNERSPVLHLTIRNAGAAGPRQVQVDYLAPGMGWQADYGLVLDATANGAPPTSGRLDCWVSVRNQTSVDIAAGVLDLVAGEISLLVGGAQSRGDSMQMQSMNSFRAPEPEWEPAPTTAEGSGIGSVHRFRLGRDLTMNANSPISRFPLLQRARVGITQRNVFENEYGSQTLARGGFVLLPRGLEVRLVSKNAGESPLPAWTERALLLLGMIVGTIVHPLVKRFRGRGLFDNPWWLAPTLASLAPVIFSQIGSLPERIDDINDGLHLWSFSAQAFTNGYRSSEMEEVFLYIFFVTYTASILKRLPAKAH